MRQSISQGNGWCHLKVLHIVYALPLSTPSLAYPSVLHMEFHLLLWWLNIHSSVRCSSPPSLVLTNANNLVPSALSSLLLFSLFDRYFNKQIKQCRAAAQRAGPKLTKVWVSLLHKIVYENQESWRQIGWYMLDYLHAEHHDKRVFKAPERSGEWAKWFWKCEEMFHSWKHWNLFQLTNINVMK